MKIDFVKIQGIGNDFIIVESLGENIDYSYVAKNICNRRFGVGADGFMVVRKSEKADIRMMYYNGDGSLAKMCGNGLRSFSKFAYDQKLVKDRSFSVETLDGVKQVTITDLDQQGSAKTIKVEMGWFRLEYLQTRLKIQEENLEIGSLVVGVPHIVIFEEDLTDTRVNTIGPMLEKHKAFSEGTNVNFAKIVDRENVTIRTWERGCGYTLGCGTGMTSVVVLGNLLGRLSARVKAHSPGGSLEIEILEAQKMITMSGPAEKICEGRYELKYSI